MWCIWWKLLVPLKEQMPLEVRPLVAAQRGPDCVSRPVCMSGGQRGVSRRPRAACCQGLALSAAPVTVYPGSDCCGHRAQGWRYTERPEGLGPVRMPGWPMKGR